VFSSQIPNDCGVKAILPRVVDPNIRTTEPNHHSFLRREPFLIAQAEPRTLGVQRRNGVPAIRIPAPPLQEGTVIGGILNHDIKHVEAHDAVLVFQTASYHPSSNWGPPEVIKKPDGTVTPYSFVRLDGDRVRFQAANSTPPLTDIANLVAPRLANELCPARVQSLGHSYLPPYSGAAAVFDLPQGLLNSCRSPTPSGDFRFDTKLVVDASGSYFVVSASTMTVRKELRLRRPTSGRLELLVGNVPKRTLKGDFTQLSSNLPNGMAHDQAYYSMGAVGSGACSMTFQQWYLTIGKNYSPLPCSMSGAPLGKPMPGSTVPVVLSPPILDVVAASFECSNTLWP
jgi:hypothetical protein